MARAPTPAPPASPSMARAVGRPCSCPAPAVSLSRLFREVAHRKTASPPRRSTRGLPSSPLSAADRTWRDASSRPSLRVAAAIRLSWRQHSLHPFSTLSIKCALAVVHYGLCFPSSRLMHAMAPAPSRSSTSPAFPRRAAARIPLLRPRPRARRPRRRQLRPSPHRRPPRTLPPPRLRLVHVARSATTILPPDYCDKQQRLPWLLRRGHRRQAAACTHRWRLRMDKSQYKIRIKDYGLNSN